MQIRIIHIQETYINFSYKNQENVIHIKIIYKFFYYKVFFIHKSSRTTCYLT